MTLAILARSSFPCRYHFFFPVVDFFFFFFSLLSLVFPSCRRFPSPPRVSSAPCLWNSHEGYEIVMRRSSSWSSPPFVLLITFYFSGLTFFSLPTWFLCESFFPLLPHIPVQCFLRDGGLSNHFLFDASRIDPPLSASPVRTSSLAQLSVP